ncbi:hypothetical protein ACOSP6_10730 [Tenacibaculum sp. MEBiC06402]|uniref:hypothetical protein n=1 Tax=unclassified Tenacibaculum TaxID=2635139 RepID=UPI003B99536C
MRGTIYVFMLLSLITFVSCNNNEEIVENQETTENAFFKSIEKISNTSSRSSAQVIFETDLMAGQHHVAGTVTLAVDGSNLVITYSTNSSWVLNETHLYAGDKDLIPVTRKGNPKIGKFPYKGEHDGVNEFSYTIPISDLTGVNCFAIATHAVVTSVCSDSPTGPLPGGPIGTLPGGSARGSNSKGKGGKTKPGSDDSNDCSRTETAWGAGTGFEGKSWAMYTSFCGGGGGNTE